MLGAAEPLPFTVFPEEDAPEESRLQYRFLDLRRSRMHENVVLRSKIVASLRERMQRHGFLELQTPTLTASSPEGARDYLVPSRVHPGKFYALPQAPQQYKQLLMVAGFDRYFQIAPCYRDEDARADRSPGEFYQLDIEMSFVEQEDVFEVVEDVLHGLFADLRPEWETTPLPFPRIPYEEAMERYGSDKPDLRIPIGDARPRRRLRRLGGARAQRRPRLRHAHTQTRALPGRHGPLRRVRARAGRRWPGLVLRRARQLPPRAAGSPPGARGPAGGDRRARRRGGRRPADDLRRPPAEGASLLGAMRDHVGQALGLVEQGAYRFCWVVDFPMYEWTRRPGRSAFSHNPFSMPQGGLDTLETTDPLEVRAFQYDIVCNGCGCFLRRDPDHRPTSCTARS